MQVLAFSDVHAPRYLRVLEDSLVRFKDKKIELVLMAGDMVDRSKVENFQMVLDVLHKYITVNNIVAVFGNEEYREYEEEFRRRYPEVKWLNDEYIIIREGKLCLGIVGSRGSLLKPTSWQRKYIPEVVEEYRRKPDIIRRLVKEAKKECPTVIYLSHYAPTWRTLVGESKKIWPYLGDPRIEKVLKDEGVRIAIHGHVHRGRVSYVHAYSMTIYNVAIPARGHVTKVKIPIQLTI